MIERGYVISVNAIIANSDDPLVLVLIVNTAEKLHAISRLVCGNHQVICNGLSTGTPALFLENRDRSVNVTLST